MKTGAQSKEALNDETDSAAPIRHTGEQPFRRPPEEEPERVGEGELDIGKRSDELSARERAWEGEDDEDAVREDQGDD